jgi:glycosyltransferase involved in cell wall biosynthesis
MNKQVLVAIHCLAYNHEPYIRDCLDGFVMQKTNFKFVAIVHDDASTDATAAIIREYAEKYPEIICPILETENQWSKPDGSLGRIMNNAISETGAKYVAMCEGDDYWIDPYKLQKQVDILENDETLIACATNTITVSNTGEIISKYKENVVKDNKEGRYNLRDFMYTTHQYPTASVVYRRMNIDKVREYCRITKNPFFGDWNLWIALHIIGDFYYIDEAMVAYRINPTSVTHSNVKKRRLAFAKANFEIIKNVQSILPEEYDDIRKELDKTAWIWFNLANAYKHSGKYLHMLWCLVRCELKEPLYAWKKIICKK